MKVVNCRTLGIQDDVNVVYIGRPGRFGNPFRMQIDTEKERINVVEDYRIWFEKQVDRDPEFRQQILNLRGHDLSCWCAPKPCHGDVIIAWLKEHQA